MLLSSVALPVAMQNCRVFEQNAKIMVFRISFSSKNCHRQFCMGKIFPVYSDLEHVALKSLAGSLEFGHSFYVLFYIRYILEEIQ